MERTRFVKTYQGEVIDLTILPLEDHHYVFDGTILWAAPDDITLGMVDAINCGTIIAHSVDRERLEKFHMPVEFFRFHQWCRNYNLKPFNGSSLTKYSEYYQIANKNTFIPRNSMV